MRAYRTGTNEELRRFAMVPHFYLHVCNGDVFTEDDEGSDYPDLAAARLAAISGLRDILAEELLGGLINSASFAEIENDQRQHLDTVLFEDAVNLATASNYKPRERRD